MTNKHHSLCHDCWMSEIGKTAGVTDDALICCCSGSIVRNITCYSLRLEQYMIIITLIIILSQKLFLQAPLSFACDICLAQQVIDLLSVCRA